jgi:hypothetical protein
MFAPLTDIERGFLMAVAAVVLLAILLRFVIKPLVGDDTRDAARYRTLRAAMYIGIGEDANLYLGATLVDGCGGSDEDESQPLGELTCGFNDAPFLSRDELEDVNGASARSTSGYVMSPDAIDRAVDWLSTQHVAKPGTSSGAGFDGVVG